MKSICWGLGEMPLHQKGLKTHCKTSSCYKTKINWEVMFIPKNLYRLYISPATLTSRSVTQEKNLDFSWIFYWCQILPMFLVIFSSIFFMKLKKNIQRSKHVCNFQHKFIGSQMADNNNKLALARWDFLGYLAIRLIIYQD